MPQPLLLASQSMARRDMLQNAGLDIECHPARIDEAALKAAFLAQNAAPRDIADALAAMKARRANTLIGLCSGLTKFWSIKVKYLINQ